MVLIVVIKGCYQYLNKKIKEKIHPHRLIGGVAWQDTPNILKGTKFDLIALSLVLHDIVSGNPIAKFKDFLSKSDSLIEDDGTIILTDIFPDVDPIEKGEQIKFWKNSMMRNGLKKDQIDDFFEFNSDMIDTVHLQELDSISKDYGYSLELKGIPVAEADQAPFKIAILKKIKMLA